MSKIKIYQFIEKFLQEHTQAEVLTLLAIIAILIIVAIIIMTKSAIKRQKDYLNKIIDERISKTQEADKTAAQPRHYMSQAEYDQYKREHGIK